MRLIIVYYFILNLSAFIFMGLDKAFSKHHSTRYSESSLLGISLIGGALGMWLGMYVFHHKTQKKKFYIIIPFFVLLHVLFTLFYINNILIL